MTIKREVAVHFWPVDRNAQHHLLQREVEVGIVENDGGVLAAHLGLAPGPARRGGWRSAAPPRWTR